MGQKQKLRRIIGDVPLFYHQNTIYVMATVINQLVDTVNQLTQQVERLETQSKAVGKDA